MPSNGPRHSKTEIVLLLFPGMTMLDAVGPFEVLWRLPSASVKFAGVDLEPVWTYGGGRLLPDCLITDILEPDVLLIGGGPGTQELMLDSAVLEYVASVDRGAQYVASVCSGALVLAAAGLLSGRRASTHELARDQLQEMGVVVSTDRVSVDGKYITSGGVTAGIDLGLVLAGLLADAITAQALALCLEYPSSSVGPSDPALVLERATALRAGWKAEIDA